MTWKAVEAVAEFTYYPIMSAEDCWFKVETHKGAGTFHQCGKHGKVKIGIYPFCERHAKIVNTAIENAVKAS